MKYLYDEKGEKFEVKFSKGISENPKIWGHDNIIIDKQDVIIYYCTENYTKTTAGEYKHFVWLGKWFKMEENFKNSILMPKELYTYRYYVNNIKSS